MRNELRTRTEPGEDEKSDGNDGVVERPDSQDSTDVKLSEVNLLKKFPFLDKEVGNQKAAEHKKEIHLQMAAVPEQGDKLVDGRRQTFRIRAPKAVGQKDGKESEKSERIEVREINLPLGSHL